jgi:hypothetical protein
MGMLDPNACRSAIAAVLATVPNIGQVWTQRRLLRDDAAVQKYLVSNGKINGWFVSFAFTNAARSDRKPGFHGIGVQGGGEVLTTFQFQIEGYYAVDDANDSEEAFANLAWSIASTINSYGGINVDGLTTQDPCDLVQITYAALANKYLTHYGRLQLGLMGRTQ